MNASQTPQQPQNHPDSSGAQWGTPTAPQQPWGAPQPPKKKMGRGKKILIGCAAGFAGLVIASAALGNTGSTDKSEASSKPSAASVDKKTSDEVAQPEAQGHAEKQGRTSSGNKTNDPRDDVKVDQAKGVSEHGMFKVPVTITNHSSEPSTYSVQLELVDKDGTRVDDTYVLVSNVEPGQTVKEEAIFLKGKGAGSDVRMVKADRSRAW